LAPGLGISATARNLQPSQKKLRSSKGMSYLAENDIQFETIKGEGNSGDILFITLW
jgi:hypothetical protein